MDLPNITIDDINFKLVGYNFKNEVIDKDSLKIISTSLSNGSTYELYLYQSETSLGFWRLGCFNRGQLYKGQNDYVQQTFIHFRLQEFINKNISIIKSIPFINTHSELREETKLKIKNDSLTHLENSFPLCFNVLPSLKYTFEHYIPTHINDESRMIHIDPFDDFDKEKSNLCGNWKKNPKSYLETISLKLSEQYELDTSSLSFLYNDLYEYNNTEFHGSPIKLHIIYNIFMCRLVSKNDGPNLFLYYTIYNIIDTLKVSKDSLIVDRHYFPLFLTTNLNITPFGTFKNYVLAAGYICKLFEYRKLSETFGHFGSKDHLYIGYMYNDLFPFNIIKTL